MKTPHHGHSSGTVSAALSRGHRVVGAAALKGASAAFDMVRKRLQAAAKKTQAKKGKTKTKSKSREIMDADGNHNNMSSRIIKINLGKKKKFEKFEGKWTFFTNYSSTFYNNQSANQIVHEGQGICTLGQLLGVVTANGAPVSNNLSWINNPFDMNPYQKTTGGTIISAGLTPAPDFVHLATVDYVMTITNLTSLATTVDVMFCLNKKTSQYGPLLDWQQANLAKGLGQARSALPTALSGVGSVYGYPYVDPAGSGYSQAKASCNTTYGLSPLSEATFRKFWKSLKRVQYDLSGGETKRIVVRIGYHKTFNKQWLSQQNSPIGLSGYTIIPLIIAKPGPIYDSVTQSMTYGLGEIGCTYSAKYNFCAPKASVSRLEYNRAGYQIIQDSTLADMKQINDVDAAMPEAEL